MSYCRNTIIKKNLHSTAVTTMRSCFGFIISGEKTFLVLTLDLISGKLTVLRT